MAVIDSAYQYYLSTYAGSGMSRYDTHKKSQLRAVYNNIVKVNKDSPLYKINFTRDTGRFAIDIKEPGPLDREFYRSAFKQCSGRQCGTRFFPEDSTVFR